MKRIKKHSIMFLPVCLLVAVIFTGMIFYGCKNEPSYPGGKTGRLSTESIDLSQISTETTAIAKNYKLEAINIELKVPAYALPLKTSGISNYNQFIAKIKLSSNADELLGNNGFVVIPNPYYSAKDITAPYDMLKNQEVPIFITTDSLLHLYHIQFDESLRQIEEKEFYDAIWNISKEMMELYSQKYSETESSNLKQVYKQNAAFFAVSLKLLEPQAGQICKAKNEWECTNAYFTADELKKYKADIPEFIASDVDNELKLIEAHKGFAESPIFKYKEDYSQYVPRGHYTRSEKLKNYFKAMMWYGRISFLLKEGLVSKDDAKIQTTGASAIAADLANNKELMSDWDRIYSITAFYVGFSDDLGPYEYTSALNKIFGGKFDAKGLDDTKLQELKAELATYRSPQIYGGTGSGTGECQTQDLAARPDVLDKCLESTKGFRLMGQRFIPDSYMLQNLVLPNVEDRLMPTSLDVMSLLGSQTAYQILEKRGDTAKKGYSDNYNKLQSEFSALNAEQWNKNLYWAWLYSLKPLLAQFGDGYPTFMQTEAWQRKELSTAAASWAELRHDTILYAKQSYTIEATAIKPEPEKKAVGYVEPVPEFYNRLLALTRMTREGLEERNAIDDTAKARLENLEQILQRLKDISEKELQNQALSEADYDFIKNFGEEVNGVIADVENKAKKTTIIADVHTDTNSGTVLEEGVGKVNLIIVAYKVPDGRILIGAGPVFSYYEFTQPMSNRLTDEAWEQMLDSNAPALPEWVDFISG